MNRISALILSLFLITTLGCGNEVDTTAPDPATEALLTAPAESGVVTREGFPVGLTWIDTSTGLRVILGADMDEFCAGIINFDILPYQDVNLADERILEVGGGEVQCTVWDFLPFDCALFTTREPAGAGQAMLVSTDNDLLGTEPDQTYANAWGWMAHGALTNPEGEPLQFSGRIRNKFSNTGGFTSNSAVRLQRGSQIAP